MAMPLVFSTYFIFLIFFPSLSTGQTAFTCSKAVYYGSPYCQATPKGACGYGEFGSQINSGYVAAVSKLYRHGTGCGACYQIKCKHRQLCDDNGVNIVVTDYGSSDSADFILSSSAFAKLAKPGLADQLMAYGSADIEYRRISCQYPGYNLMLKITEHSTYPHYIAVLPLYQAGQKDITAMEIWQEDCKEWKPMRKPYGAVWDRENPPKGPLNLRLTACGDDGQKQVELNAVIPYDWKAGAIYDSNTQLS